MEVATRTRSSLPLDLLVADYTLQPAYPLVQLPAQNLEVWYTGDSSSSDNNPAREAYEEAIRIFKKELTKDECKRIWLDDMHTISDVQSAIQQARSDYESSSRKSKAREWLSRCASRIVYYGNVMDVMVQGCPEYASFAWGALKFLFIAVMNHEELLVEISKAVTKIADVLPRAELLSILYPTERMKIALSELYAKIIQFIQSAVKYYKKGRIAKSIAAVKTPFDLKYKPILEDIREASRRVDELANSALKAEIRDLHIQVKRLTEITLATQSLQNQMAVDLTSQRGNYEGSQIELIQSLPIFQKITSHEDTLQYCRSMTRRRRIRMPCSLSHRDMNTLKTWFDSKESSILIGESHGIKTSSRDFAVSLLDLVLQTSLPAIWVLPMSISNEDIPDIEDVLASLVIQAMDLNPSVLSTGVNPISTRHFKSPLPMEKWLQLLQKSIQGLKCLLIVLDFTMLQACMRKSNLLEPEEFLEALLNMKGLQGPTLKIVALTWKLEPVIASRTEDPLATQFVATDPGPRKVRLMKSPKFRAAFSARRQKLAVALKEATLTMD